MPTYKKQQDGVNGCVFFFRIHDTDHVFIGTFDNEPKLNPDEVMAYRWVELDDLKKDMEKNPQNYTAWFKIIFEHYVSYIEE